MLAWVVIYRLHHRQAARPHTTHAVAEGHRRTFHSLTPFLYLFTSLLPYFLFARHVTKNLSPQLLWNLHLQNGDARNSFRIRSYQKCRVSLALSFLFSLLAPRVFHISFPIMRFRTLSKKHPGGGSLSPQVWTFRRWVAGVFLPKFGPSDVGTFTHSGELLQSGVALRQATGRC